MGHAAMDFDTQFGNIGKTVSIIRRCIDGLTKVLAHFIGIYIECGRKFNIINVISTKIYVHQSWHKIILFRITIIMNTLYKGTGTISYTKNGNAYFFITRHELEPSIRSESTMPKY